MVSYLMNYCSVLAHHQQHETQPGADDLRAAAAGENREAARRRTSEPGIPSKMAHTLIRTRGATGTLFSRSSIHPASQGQSHTHANSGDANEARLLMELRGSVIRRLSRYMIPRSVSMLTR